MSETRAIAALITLRDTIDAMEIGTFTDTDRYILRRIIAIGLDDVLPKRPDNAETFEPLTPSWKPVDKDIEGLLHDTE